MSLLLVVGISQTVFLICYISLDKLQKIAKIFPARSLHRDHHRQSIVVLSIALTVLLDISTVRLLHVSTMLHAFLLETGPRYRSVIVSFFCVSLMSFLNFWWTSFAWISFSKSLFLSCFSFRFLFLFPSLYHYISLYLSISLSVSFTLFISQYLSLSISLSLSFSLSFSSLSFSFSYLPAQVVIYPSKVACY